LGFEVVESWGYLVVIPAGFLLYSNTKPLHFYHYQSDCMANKHNLSRTIPEPVKREVRQRCGFGCVVCGSAIYDYEHFDPEFSEAKEHNPDGIALLCPTDHARKRKKLLSQKKYLKAIANPKALQLKKAGAEWETANFAPTIVIGQKMFTGGTSVLKIDGELLLGFNEPEEDGLPPRLNFRFFDSQETEVFAIIDNEISVYSDSFDIETVGHVWTVRSKLYKVDLVIELNPPNHIYVKQLNFQYKKWGLAAKDENFELTYDDNPNILVTGPLHAKGPCMFNLEGEGKVEMKDMELTFLPSPQHEQAKTIIFEWPLFLYVDAEDDTAYEDIELLFIKGTNFMPIFSSQEKAVQSGAEKIPDKYKLKSLGKNGFIKLLEKVALPKGVKAVVLDLDLDAEFQTYTAHDIATFIETNSKKVYRNDPCICGSGLRHKDCHGKLQ